MSDPPPRSTPAPPDRRHRPAWRSLWVPTVVAVVPAAMFLLIGSGVRQPNGVPYRCPSAVRQLVGGDQQIRPTVLDGELRLYDPADPALVNPSGVAGRCRSKNLQATGIAAATVLLGLGIGMFRAGVFAGPARTGLGSETDGRTNPRTRVAGTVRRRADEEVG